MPDAARIRPARLSDAPELAGLTGELGYPADTVELERRLAALLGDPDHLVLVAARADDRAIAWLHAALRRQLSSDAQVEVEGLVVGEAARSAGVGACLLARAEAWALERGVPQVRLHSNVIRQRAHGFYRRAGYELVKTSCVFRKRLSP